MTGPAQQDALRSALRFDSTVPRAMVHRAAIAEVFLTDSRRVPDQTDTYEVAAQLPRAHIMGEQSGTHDFLLLIEMLRQAGVFLAHTYEDVPLDESFIFRHLQTEVRDQSALRTGDRPARAVATLTVLPQRKRNGRVQAIDFSGSLAIEDKHALQCSGGLAFFTRGVYQALRERRRRTLADTIGVLPTHVAAVPASVGRRDPYNVVITRPVAAGESAFAATVLSDTTHPHLFDHQLDHVPGNLLLEAARQLAAASVSSLHAISAHGLQVTSMDAQFQEFAELDLQTRAVARVEQFRLNESLGTLVIPVVVDILQQGRAVASFRLEVAQ
ncbi:ScbA/BarX family gamma-butyrolactone biosynthesis protein [Streptomyces sp. H34-S4]|uniref:ScbA/BarX family gamma-butyrolactone biosynthesis protein n=1 Tax=Streptomyces sp. H34-S4 TaxID=2996463 RepID=UPI00226FDFDA|nr:ScbA/BarX family gamma-butyrolactone biosynthesis protein [Streptomyces sp. H34-S4]MCY0934581.1 ScbA/BarX family gamma-butyrolactone biosynthesis protein [Streptomyces sp. H34-S4]